MKFFTPELYRLYNSSDEDEADRADELWEQAIQDYQAHLKTHQDWLPAPVRQLCELNLHDAKLLGTVSSYQTGLSPVAVATLQQRELLHTLIYSLWDNLREQPAELDWPFSKTHLHWLYDEVDVNPHSRGMFLHRILFSDGSTLEIPCQSVVINTVSLATEPAIIG